MRHVWTLPLTACLLAGGLVSCGGGGASSTAANPPAVPPVIPPAARTTGFIVPTEVTPVSTGASAAQPARIASFGQALAALSAPRPEAATDAGTDYSKAQTTRYVSEHAIDQFSIIETILNATSQTHYADAENIGAGPYKSIVSWQQDQQGSQAKTIQTWVVDSKIIQVAGKDVNQVDAWIEDSGRVIRAQFKISASATMAADGSYLDYGVWTLNVGFDQDETQFFAAEASIGPAGEAVVAISQSQMDGGSNQIQTTRAVMHKSAATGYGKVYYPDWQNNVPVQTTASYVYNAGQLLVHKSVPAPDTKTYQDRTASVEITDQYGLYDAVTGVDVTTTHSFGFPVAFTLGGVAQNGYYGAWQGAHSLWLNDGTIIPDGTPVTRQDQGVSGASYLTASFRGTLVKRTYTEGALADLLNIPVQTNISINHQLTWNAAQSQWTENGAPFTDWASLVAQPQQSVWINAMTGPNPVMLCYDPNGASGAGFYPATPGGNGTMTPTPGGARFAPADGTTVWVNINGSIYIEYQGATAGWVRKSVTAFDQNTWTPTFDPLGDVPFTLILGYQYFINNQGGNFIVTRTAGGTDVQMEIQTPANPVNVAAVTGAAATFRPQNFDPQSSSTYQFVTDPASAKYLMLVYRTVGTQDAATSPAPQVGDVVAQGQWSMEAFDAGQNDLQLQYDWNCPGTGMGATTGVQTFLYTTSGSTRTYKLLDNPIQLAPLPMTVNGVARTLSLQFNGWMNGLPDYSSVLAINNYTITTDIASKIINIPAGTAVTDQNDPSTTYLIKPLQIGLYLPVAAVPDTSLSLAAADGLDLGDPAVIPVFVPNGLGAEPSNLPVKYSDGVKVQ